MLFAAAPRHLTPCRTVLPEHAANPSLGRFRHPRDVVDTSAPARRARSFPHAASTEISLSGVRSATTLRSRWFPGLQLLQTLRLIDLQATELPAPPMMRHFGHAARADHVRCRASSRYRNINLPKLRDDPFGPGSSCRVRPPPGSQSHASRRTIPSRADQPSPPSRTTTPSSENAARPGPSSQHTKTPSPPSQTDRAHTSVIKMKRLWPFSSRRPFPETGVSFFGRCFRSRRSNRRSRRARIRPRS